MTEGFIKIHRSIADHWIFNDANRFKWWFDLLLMAKWEDVKVVHDSHLFTLKRGQMIASGAWLAERWDVSRPTVLKFLHLLEQEEMIKRQTLYRQTPIITICNYDKYQQRVDTIVDTIIDTQVDTIVDTHKEYKEDKEYITSKEVCHPQDELKEILEFFNETMNKADAIIPHPIKSINGQRRTMVQARLKEYGKDAVFDVITKASQSGWMNGNNPKAWVADFNWMMKPNNFVKVLEGNYDNRQQLVLTSKTNNNYDLQQQSQTAIPANRASQERIARKQEAESIIARLMQEDYGRINEVSR